MSHERRMDEVRLKLDDCKVDGLLVTNLTNVRYLTGFSGTNAQLLITGERATFFSDPRYEARAAALVRGAEIEIYPVGLTEILGRRLASASVERLGFEAATMSVAERDEWEQRLDGVELVSTTRVVEDLRRVKDDEEVAAIREAVRLADEAFDWILQRLQPGRTEREIALDLEIRMRTHGAEGASFEPIVGSGELSAHIHHTPSERVLQPGDLVLLDFGALVGGYCSDLTRTVVLGPATQEQRDVYQVVLEALATGVDSISVTATGVDVDAAARRVISAAGDGDNFGHGLGHGVGLDIHEAPRLHRSSTDTLVAGDVVTVEPGIYRVGWGGIRIEDCVLVTADGATVLGRAPRSELIEL